MDVIANRQLLARLRRIARGFPLAWPAYRMYWKTRRWLESRKDYPENRTVQNFGGFASPTLDQPVTQLCTSAQMLCKTYDCWCDAMHSPARFSRKQWEFVFILQALSLRGMLSPGRVGLGFGCGREPLAGLFARYGCQVVATDLAPETAKDQGWVATMQHASSLEALYQCAEEFVSREVFFDRVDFRVVDMNTIPDDLSGKFDFVWSACALEHLGSLRHGMDFVKNSVRCLKPGGVAVHTTEFNISSLEQTLESPGCSIYRACDIEQLIRELVADGHEVAPLNLNTGTAPVDHHVDLPPYGFSPHLKLMLEGYVVTSIGLIVSRPTGLDQ